MLSFVIPWSSSHVVPRMRSAFLFIASFVLIGLRNRWTSLPRKPPASPDGAKPIICFHHYSPWHKPLNFPKAAQGPPGKSKVCGCSHYPGCCCTIFNIPAPGYNLTVSFPSCSSGSLLKDCIPSPSLWRTSELSLLNGKPFLHTQSPARRFQADGPYQKVSYLLFSCIYQ